MIATNETTHPLPASDRVGLDPNKEGVQTVSHDNNWNEKVARGRALVSEINDRKWELGDLANDVCPAGANGSRDHDGELGKFAEAIGAPTSTLREYRRVSAAWAPATRVAGQTWTTHRLLAERDDRRKIIAEKVWTYNALTERLGNLPNPSRVRQDESVPSPSAPAAIAYALASEAGREALVNSPEAKRIVREAIAANPDVARVAMDALDKRYEDSPKPIAPRESDVADNNADLIGEFLKLHKGVDHIVQLVNQGKVVVSDGHRDAILREVKWLRTALGYIEDGVASNALADEIALFLQEQA